MARFIFTSLGFILKNHSSIINYFDILVQDLHNNIMLAHSTVTNEDIGLHEYIHVRGPTTKGIGILLID